MVLFNPVKDDLKSPSSVFGAVGMVTENDSAALMAFTRLYLSEDRWRITAAGGSGSINFQFRLANPIDRWIPYNTSADFAYVAVQRRVWRDLFVGLTYTTSRFDTTTNLAPSPASATLHGIGAKASLDRSESVYYPRGGYQTELNYTSYPSGFGNQFESDILVGDYTRCDSMRGDTDVLASRFHAGIGLGDLSFNQQFIVGDKDIRGYSQGAFRGNSILAAQTEYRWNVWRRLGFVGFGGVATVFEAINPDDSGRLLPAGGVGFRITADKETHLNVGLDVAAGIDDWGVYFRVGEAF
ncbi:MAG: hypothetical protein AAF726_04570 [Planctomycetota bacterium]